MIERRLKRGKSYRERMSFCLMKRTKEDTKPKFRKIQGASLYFQNTIDSFIHIMKTKSIKVTYNTDVISPFYIDIR